MAFKINRINHEADCSLLKFKCTKHDEISNMHTNTKLNIKKQLLQQTKKNSLANDYEDNKRRMRELIKSNLYC